jgi:glycerophosphoryl diester phosphodiesterase
MSSHLIDQLPRPIIFGHRGASNYAPENTLSSFQTAFNQGASAIELDVMLSSDEELVIIHDTTVDRTTISNGKVNELTLDVLKKFDAGSKYSTKYQGEKIPTLDEVFDLTGGRFLVNIELKNYHSPRDCLVEKVIDLVIKRNMNDSVIFSSFLPGNIIKVRKRLPNAPAALLTYGGLIGKLEILPFFRFLSPHFIHPNYQLIDEKFIHREHVHHRRVNVWTVDKKADLEYLVMADVDGIITNDPILALKIRNSLKIEHSRIQV